MRNMKIIHNVFFDFYPPCNFEFGDIVEFFGADALSKSQNFKKFVNDEDVFSFLLQRFPLLST